MREELLHYIWQVNRYNASHLCTTDSEPVQVVFPGNHNAVAGPDFLTAKVRIGTTLWAGNVEIHIRTSDWLRHGHQHDPVYQNLVLHVVWEHDLDELPANIPVLELKGRVFKQVVDSYERLIRSRSWIPCASLVGQVAAFTRDHWIERMLFERLEKRTKLVQEQLEQTQGDWDEVLYRMLGRNFGFHHNAAGFEELTRHLPYRIIRKHHKSRLELEALLLGVAGLLSTPKKPDAYSRELERAFSFLQKKYALSSMVPGRWKYGGIRPGSFPELRIAQLAALLANDKLFAHVRETDELSHLDHLMECEPHDYWKQHYRLGVASSRSRSGVMGRRSRELVVINTLVPVVFAYGRQYRDDRYTDRVFGWLEKLPAESNSIITQWKSLLLKIASAAQSQGLLELKSAYCDQKRCLECSIGHALLRE